MCDGSVQAAGRTYVDVCGEEGVVASGPARDRAQEQLVALRALRQHLAQQRCAQRRLQRAAQAPVGSDLRVEVDVELHRELQDRARA